MARWRLITGVAGVATGVIAAGAGVVLAAEKIAVGRQRMRPDPEAGEPLGELRGQPLTVLAGDGAALHAEIDGPDDAPVTVMARPSWLVKESPRITLPDAFSMRRSSSPMP